MIYKFKSAYRRRTALDAQIVGEALEQVRVSHDGRLIAENVVMAAKVPTSPLHAGFTWDDGEAAHKWRLEEAQLMIRCVLAVNPKEPDFEQKAFYHIVVKRTDDTPSDSYYQSVTVIAKSPLEYEAALKAAVGNLADAQTVLERLHRIAPKLGRINIQKAAAHVTEAHRVLNTAV